MKDIKRINLNFVYIGVNVNTISVIGAGFSIRVLRVTKSVSRNYNKTACNN